MTKKVLIDIGLDGSVKIEAEGFNGCGCTTATEELELVLGGAAQKKKSFKPDYYRAASGVAKNKLTF